MVGRAVGRAVDAVAGDWRAFIRQMRVVFGRGHSTPGLYTYRKESRTGKTRVHLRVHTDGSGDLFVNVSDPVHLSPAATEIARMLLDGVSAAQVTACLQRWYPNAPRDDLAADVGLLADLVYRAGEPSDPCPACTLGLQRTELFTTRAKAPYKADLALTYECNNACLHCYNEPGRKALPHLDGAQWRQVIRTLARVGVPHLIFTGGEPTLHPQLTGLVRLAEKLGVICGLNTNGRRLADTAFVRELTRAGLDHVQITLLSHEPAVHDRIVQANAHAETVEGIRNCLSAGLHTITNTTLTRDNCGHILETLSLVRDLGVRTFAVNSMICSGSGRCNPAGLREVEVVPVLADLMEFARVNDMRMLWYTPTEYCRLSPLELGLGPKCCNAAEYSVCVEPNGDVLPCQSYYEPAGNLLRDGWECIWESDLFRAIRMRREAPREAGLPEKCWNCEDLQVCGGGCPLRRQELERDLAGAVGAPTSDAPEKRED